MTQTVHTNLSKTLSSTLTFTSALPLSIFLLVGVEVAGLCYTVTKPVREELWLHGDSFSIPLLLTVNTDTILLTMTTAISSALNQLVFVPKTLPKP